MKTLVCFGDSNTHGAKPMCNMGNLQRFDPLVRWPGIAANHLGGGWQVIEEGHRGRTTVHDDPIDGIHKNGLPAILVAMETHRPVDVIAIMLGTNDLKCRFSVSALDIALSVEKLVAAARDSNGGPDCSTPGILLIAPPTIRETGCLQQQFVGGADKSAEFGALFREVAERQGIPFLDAGVLIKPSSLDGIHLDKVAHATLGTAIADAIAGEWPTIE